MFYSPEPYLYLIVVLSGVVGSVLLVSFLVRSLIAWARGNRADQEATREILNRVGTGAEVSAFLNSEGGRQLLRAMVHAQRNGNGREGLLRVMAVGIVLICFGIGLMIPRLVYRVPEFTSVITMIGVGMVLASRVALRMRKEWGDEDEEKEARQSLNRNPIAPQESPRESPDSPHELG